MSLICPKCNTINLDEARFCKECGCNIQEELEKIETEKRKIEYEKKINEEFERNIKEEAERQQKEDIDAQKAAQQKRYQEENERLAKEINSNIEIIDLDHTWLSIFPILLLTFAFIGTLIYGIYKSSSSSNKTVIEVYSNQSSNSNSNSAIYYLELAGAFWDTKNYHYSNPDKVLEYLNKAIQIEKTNATAYNRKGIVYSQLGNHKEALKNYIVACQLSPQNGIFIQNRGYGYLNVGDNEKAKTDAITACKLGSCDLKNYFGFHLTIKTIPSDAKVRVLNIVPKYHDDILLEKGEYQIEISKDGYETIYKWVQLEKDTNLNFTLSKQTLTQEQIHKDHKDYAVEYFNKLQALWDDKSKTFTDNNAALNYINKAIELDPNNASYHNYRGVVQSYLQNHQESLSSFIKACNLIQNNATFITNRGYAYLNTRNIEKAKEDAQRACQLGNCKLKENLETFVINYENKKLIWQIKNITNNKITWINAGEYCKNLNLFGHNDFRLPSKEELESLKKYEIKNIIPSGTYWSNAKTTMDYVYIASIRTTEYGNYIDTSLDFTTGSNFAICIRTE